MLEKTLESVHRHKHPSTTVEVFEDTTKRRCPGKARLDAIRKFYASGLDVCLFMDNDMLCSPGFDTWSEEWCDLIRKVDPYPEHCPRLVSPFRSSMHPLRDLDVRDGFIASTIASGCALAMSRETIKAVLSLMPYRLWNNYWDYTISGFIQPCIKPLKSFMLHVGTDALATHKCDVEDGIGYDHSYR